MATLTREMINCIRQVVEAYNVREAQRILKANKQAKEKLAHANSFDK